MEAKGWILRVPLWLRVLLGLLLGAVLVLGVWFSWGIWAQGLIVFVGIPLLVWLLFLVLSLPAFLTGVLLQLLAGPRRVPRSLKWLIGVLGTVLLSSYRHGGSLTVDILPHTLGGWLDGAFKAFMWTAVLAAAVDAGITVVGRYRDRGAGRSAGSLEGPVVQGREA